MTLVPTEHMPTGLPGQILLGCAVALALWQLVAFAAAPPSALKSAVKTGSVAALAILAMVLGLPGAVIAGLALGAIGDFFLSRPGERAFLAGMGAFAAGHAAYAAFFVMLGAGSPPLMSGLAVGLVALAAALFIAPRAGALCWPVRGYIVVILAMVLAALGTRGHPLAQLGALMFMASDFVLALQLFVLPPGRGHRVAAHAVWALYWPSQLVLLAAALFPPAP